MIVPKIVNWDWKRVVPQIVSIFALMAIFYFFLPDEYKDSYVFFGAGVYLIYSVSSRNIIPRNHRRGVRALSQKNFDEAIELFTKSKEFFERNSWIDEYRYITLMSPSAYSYREMAMLNIAFAYSQKGEGAKAKESYLAVLSDYPNNVVAKNTIRLIEGIENKYKC